MAHWAATFGMRRSLPPALIDRNPATLAWSLAHIMQARAGARPFIAQKGKGMIELFVAAIFMVQAVPQLSGQAPPLAVSRAEVFEHAPGLDELFVRVNRDPRKWLETFSSITIDVVANVAGEVISAKAVPDGESLPEAITQAESLVRTLRFRPFERNGHAVAAKFQVMVSVLPRELKPALHVPFPKVRDWKTMKITLERGSPYGTDYTIAVFGDGTVLYKGISNVAFMGTHRGSVPPGNVAELVRLFEQADYYSLRDEYSVHADSFSQTTSIEIDGHRKQVENTSGLEVGMPLAVERLEQAIDRLSGSERWTQGNAETMAALEAEHWDFKSAQAANTLARAAGSGNAAVVRDLARAGVPLTGYSQLDRTSGTKCCTALETAAARGDLIMLQALLDAGAGSRAEQMGRALVASAGSGKVEAFRFLLANGASLAARDERGRTALMAAAFGGFPATVTEVLKSRVDVNTASTPPPPRCAPEITRQGGCPEFADGDGATALMAAVEPRDYDAWPEGVDRVEVVRLLLAAGADVNARDKRGNTALLLTNNLEQAVLLLQAGADPNAHNQEGTSAFSNTSGDDIKRLLIEHGAVEPAKNAKGK